MSDAPVPKMKGRCQFCANEYELVPADVGKIIDCPKCGSTIRMEPTIGQQAESLIGSVQRQLELSLGTFYIPARRVWNRIGLSRVSTWVGLLLILSAFGRLTEPRDYFYAKGPGHRFDSVYAEPAAANALEFMADNWHVQQRFNSGQLFIAGVLLLIYGRLGVVLDQLRRRPPAPDVIAKV